MSRPILVAALLAASLIVQAVGQTVAPAACPTPSELDRRLEALRAAAKHPHWDSYMAALKAQSAALGRNRQAGADALGALRQAVANAGRLAADIASLPASTRWRRC